MKPFLESSFAVTFFGDGSFCKIVDGWLNVKEFIHEQCGPDADGSFDYLTGPESPLHDQDNWMLCDGSPDGDNRMFFHQCEFTYCVGLAIVRITDAM